MKFSNKIILKDNKIAGAELCVSFYFNKKKSEVIARCAPLMITTYGKDLAHAKEMFKEAFELWLESVNEDFNAIKVLEELGWKLKKSEAIARQNKQEPVEFPFLSNNEFRLNIPAFAWAS